MPDLTFHLTPEEVWETQKDAAHYTPEAYDADGFIHCTDGEHEVIAVGNRYYSGDPRSFVLLSIQPEHVASEIRYKDPDRIFPHIYGPLNRDAIVGVRKVIRSADGSFVSISE